MDNWRRFRIGGSGGTNANGQSKDTPTLDLANGAADGKGKDRDLGDDLLWGLENFGNTCYCNSILQALYASPPFRHFVEAYPDVAKPYNALGGPIATEPIRTPSPDNAGTTANGKANGHASEGANASNTGTKEKRGLSFGFGKKSSSNANAPDSGAKPPTTLQPAAPAAPAQPAPPPIILPHDPNFPDMTLFSTIQTLFHHLSTSLPHHPAAPKTPAAANGQTNATGNNAASLPSASLSAATNGAAAGGGQPQGPSLLASLPPPSTPRGGGPYLAGTLGRGVVRPEDVLRTVRKHHVMFAGQGQQDAHEFLGFMLNQLAEEVERLDGELRERGEEVTTIKERGKTFIHNLFQGVLVNETRCLNCETTSSREESFLDLSIDIEQHSSLTACLRQFSHSEMLCSTNKFYCETCCSLVEAERRMRIKSLPNILGLHLKRFRQDEMGRLHKLFYRVTFPLQLRVPCTTEDTDDAERLYELFAVVVHIGNGPTHGHYVTVVRAGNQWVMCDDENVEPIEEADLANYFGDNITGAGYVLFYQAVNLDLKSLGLKKMPEPRVAPSVPRSVPIVEVDEETEDVTTGTEDEKAVDASEVASAVSGTSAPVPTTPISDVHPQVVPGTTPQAPPALTVVTPTKAAPTATVSSKTDSSGSGSRVATPNGSVGAVESPAQPALSPSPLSPTSRREASTSSYFRRDTSTTRSPQEKSKWYSLKKRESMSHSPASGTGSTASGAASTPARPGTRRQSTTTTLNTLSSSMHDEASHGAHTTGGRSTPSHSHSPVRAPVPADTQDLSSSMLSTSTNSSNHSSSLGVPIPRGTGTNANANAHGPRSQSMSRPDRGYSLSRADRTASGTQMSGGTNFAGGSSLGRKISGAAGFGKFKMGFGKKNRVDE